MENFIIHYGVPGMKWRIRRTKKQLSKARKKVSDLEKKTGDSKSTPDNKTKNEPEISSKKKKISIDDMSNDDLQKYIERLRLEQQLTEIEQRQKEIPTKDLQNYVNSLNLNKQISEINRRPPPKSNTEKILKTLETAAKISSSATTIGTNALKIKKLLDGQIPPEPKKDKDKKV